MDTTSDFLFTYGTLMQGYDNPFAQKLRETASYHSAGSFPGLLYRVSWYPGAHYKEDITERVYGEIYRMNNPAKLLPALDEYEDVFEDQAKSLYVRKIITVSLPNHSVLRCWTYLYNQSVENLSLIQGGDFRKSQHP